MLGVHVAGSPLQRAQITASVFHFNLTPVFVISTRVHITPAGPAFLYCRSKTSTMPGLGVWVPGVEWGWSINMYPFFFMLKLSQWFQWCLNIGSEMAEWRIVGG